MRNALLIITALGMSACSGSSYTYAGYQIFDHFPLDGQRSWEYANDEITIDYKMEIRMSELETVNDDMKVHEFQYYNQDTGSLLMTVTWSSDSSNGVNIHGFQTFEDSGGGGTGGPGGPGGDDTGDTGLGSDAAGGPGGGAGSYDFTADPVQFGQAEMAPGDSVTSSGGGWNFTSTFESVEPCPNHWVGEDWDECLRFTLDDGVDGPGGAAIAGSYWIVPRYGIAWMQLEGDPDVWRLVKANWSPTE